MHKHSKITFEPEEVSEMLFDYMAKKKLPAIKHMITMVPCCEAYGQFTLEMEVELEGDEK